MSNHDNNVEGATTVTAAHAMVTEAVTSAALVLLDKAVIKKDQDGIRRSLVKLDASIHSNAVQCLMHAEKHGDTSLMRRLLVDIIDAKSGYRRQGIIAWMREFSPMRLKGDVIVLSGLGPDGERQAFRCEEANKTPFTALASAREFVPERPIFKDNLTSKIDRAVKDYRAAIENTLLEPGQPPRPKDVKKPFYNGIHLDKMEEAFDQIEKIATDMLSFDDSTKEVYVAKENLKKAQIELEASAASDK